MPLCNYEKCVAAKMDYDKEAGTLRCSVCAAIPATINYLARAKVTFFRWIDQCEAEDEERRRRRRAIAARTSRRNAPAPSGRIDLPTPRKTGRGGSQRRPGAA